MEPNWEIAVAKYENPNDVKRTALDNNVDVEFRRRQTLLRH